MSVLHHNLVVDSTERGRRHCSGEFKQLLLTCIEGCGLLNNSNRFKVRAAAAGMRTVLTIDIRTAREMRFSVSFNTANNSCIILARAYRRIKEYNWHLAKNST